MRDWKKHPPESHEEAVEMATEILTCAAQLTADLCGCEPPPIQREDKNGQTTLKLDWGDGNGHEVTISSGRIQ